jgi:hypothetical protein
LGGDGMRKAETQPRTKYTKNCLSNS